MVKPAAGGLEAVYREALSRHGFGEDAAQLAAVREFERLSKDLLRAEKLSMAARLMRRFSSEPGHGAAVQGLYLWGGVGRGKTWLMDLFFHAVPVRAKRRAHFHRFMLDVHHRLAEHRDVEDPLALVADEIAALGRLQCFDELFVSDIADAMILGNLIRHLIDRGVTFVFTSNVPPAELYREGLQRQRFLPAIELIERRCHVLRVDAGVDYRLRHLTQAPIYVLSWQADADRRLEEIYADLSDGDTETAGTLEIQGRPISVVRESENVAWFEFGALCEGARSQNDYIELAREYQAIVVSNVPVLDSSREDAARRFIALVDEFYDRRVKLILSAAAPPDRLYAGERLKFEFQRTLSRITEMQTEEYLASEHRA